MSKVYQVPEAMMNRIYNTLSNYANEASYLPPRIGGVVAGCPRGPAPTPTQLAMNAKFMLREIDRDLLGRPTPASGTCDCRDAFGRHLPECPKFSGGTVE